MAVITTPDRTAELESILEERVMVLDGSWGVMLQSMELSEEQYRGERFADHEYDLKGCIDALVLTQPEIVEDTQRQYLDAGADILTTNTFTSTRFGLSEFGLESHVYEINRQAASLARNVADEYSDRTPEKPRFVAGSIGPTNKTLSISPDVNDPAYRDVTFDDLVGAYSDAARGLFDGGAHILLVETVFDTLNARAALYAIETVFEERRARVPVMVSFTAVDLSGRNLSGQTAEAFYASVTHVPLLSVGINCSLGSDQMRPFLVALSNVSSHSVACYPNAGLPNEFGEYDETASQMAASMGDFAKSGLANIVGSCCGSRPEHTRAIADTVEGVTPRRRPPDNPNTVLSGLDVLEIRPDSNFVNVGERANVTGSARFRRLIRSGKYEDAVSVAKQQVEDGAQVLDVNMDEGMLDSEAAMERYLKLLASEPDISRLPIMVDSSRFSVIEAGLRCLQGKGVVNSISLKEGEGGVHPASSNRQEIWRGCDSHGLRRNRTGGHRAAQSGDLRPLISAAHRAHRIRSAGHHLRSQHLRRRHRHRGAQRIRRRLYRGRARAQAPLSAFTRQRRASATSPSHSAATTRSGEAIHSVFLYHATRAGMDMGIVNAGQLQVYEQIEPSLREAVEDVVLNRRPDATERLLEIARQCDPQRQGAA